VGGGRRKQKAELAERGREELQGKVLSGKGPKEFKNASLKQNPKLLSKGAEYGGLGGGVD